MQGAALIVESASRPAVSADLLERELAAALAEISSG
jgi:hypothetical protein